MEKSKFIPDVKYIRKSQYKYVKLHTLCRNATFAQF